MILIIVWSFFSYNKMFIGLDDREHLFQKIARYFIIDKQQQEINQMLDGFHPDLMSLMKRFPDDAIKELLNMSTENNERLDKLDKY